jgi:hypothetical protein
MKNLIMANYFPNVLLLIIGALLSGCASGFLITDTTTGQQFVTYHATMSPQGKISVLFEGDEVDFKYELRAKEVVRAGITKLDGSNPVKLAMLNINSIPLAEGVKFNGHSMTEAEYIPLHQISFIDLVSFSQVSIDDGEWTWRHLTPGEMDREHRILMKAKRAKEGEEKRN